MGVVDEDDYSSDVSDVSDEDGEEAEFFTIPKKPQWTQTMAPEEYRQLETDTFLKWKRQLNKMQNKHPNLPPFEKNLEFWRQLWKIVEISDIVVQVSKVGLYSGFLCPKLKKNLQVFLEKLKEFCKNSTILVKNNSADWT